MKYKDTPMIYPFTLQEITSMYYTLYVENVEEFMLQVPKGIHSGEAGYQILLGTILETIQDMCIETVVKTTRGL